MLALPLETALAELSKAGFAVDIKYLLPPRDEETDVIASSVRKYVVRQRELSDHKISLTVVCRV